MSHGSLERGSGDRHRAFTRDHIGHDHRTSDRAPVAGDSAWPLVTPHTRMRIQSATTAVPTATVLKATVSTRARDRRSLRT